MPTIAKGEDLNKIHDAHKSQFQEGKFPFSLHNLLWQLIYNQRDSNELFVLHAVDGANRLLVKEFGMEADVFTLAKVFYNKPGYADTCVAFEPQIPYKECCEICDEINQQLFGIMPALATTILRSSGLCKMEPINAEDDRTLKFALLTADSNVFTSADNLEQLYKVVKAASLQEQDLYVTDTSEHRVIVPVKQVYDSFEAGKTPTDLFTL